MKTLIGIDTPGHYRPALPLLNRLAFADWEAHLLHVVEVMLDKPRPDLRPDDPLTPFFIKWEDEGYDELESAEASLATLPKPPEKELRYGSPARVLIEVADELDVDLLAVGSGRKGAVGSLFLGSVSRALVIAARRSVLIAKGDPEREGPVHAVLATDHSEYMDRCIDMFVAMRPGGLGRVSVLTATRFHTGADGRQWSDVRPPGAAGAAWSREELLERGERVCARLRTLGCDCETRIVEAHPNEAIRQSMQGADLLILGAQGHSFWERLRVGSIALHQTITEPHPVLVLRQPS